MQLTPALAVILLPGALLAQTSITASNWGSVTTPIYGTYQAGAYGGAELFPGPNQFGFYFGGVLPNGRKVIPAGITNIQVGMNPIASALTPDNHYYIVANSTERQTGYVSYLNPMNTGGYSLTVIDNTRLTVVSQLNVPGGVYSSLIATGVGPYTIYASGGSGNDVKVFTLNFTGILTPAKPASIPILPLLPAPSGAASNYAPAASTALFAANGYLATGAKATFPAGMQFSPDGRFLYVACNADNSIAVIDVYQNTVVSQLPAGYFPYGVAVSADGQRIFTTNWGLDAYQFESPTYDSTTGNLLSIAPVPGNVPDGFYVPKMPTPGVSAFRAPVGNGYFLSAQSPISNNPVLDDLSQVGGAHPSAAVTVRASNGIEILFYTKSNSDSLGMVRLDQYAVLPDFDLSPIALVLSDGHKVHGSYPTAIAASPNGSRLYVAESGINSVAVLDISRPLAPVLLGRIPTGWYPTSLALTFDGQFLFITNAKGIGEDLNQLVTAANGNQPPTGIASDAATDSNSMFGTVQIVPVGGVTFDSTTVLANNYAMNTPADTSVVPAGGFASRSIKHVFVIVQENKTFDSVLGALPSRFGAFASQTFQTAIGANYFNPQSTAVAPNAQTLALNFATAVNFYSDAEESNAGAQFLASGTATDYTEKTVLNAGGRGLLANRNADPEDYPEGGYIFNNAARNGVSFKDYGFLTALAGSDNGASAPASLDAMGLGQQYFLATPGLAVFGEKNATGEPRIDLNYAGVNANITDQTRATEFIRDFDRMVAARTLPQLIYIYQPSSDADAALGMVVSHIMSSPAYYDPQSNTGSAIFLTYASSQTAVDHIHPHRNLLVTISPFAKPGYLATRHYSSASIVKTAELLLGLPPNNLGDLFATDLRDMFQSTYNGITNTNIPLANPALSGRMRVTIGH